MIASALSMKSHLAWFEADAGKALELARASVGTSGTAAGVRALSAQQLARAYALRGEAEKTERWLDEAERLTGEAAADPAGQPAWVYFHDPVRLRTQRAVAYSELGRGAEAVELLVTCLHEVDPAYRRDRGWHVARLAFAHAVAGDVEESVTALLEAAGCAIESGSAQILSDVRRARRRLRTAWPTHPAVREMDDALRSMAA